MADWSVWKALEEWRGRRRELDPLFAQAGIAPDLTTAINRVCVDLRRQPPTRPLISGDKSRDDVELGRYHEAYFRYFDESLYKVENLLRQPWVPEAAALVPLIEQELQRLRQQMREHPGQTPSFADLEALLDAYQKLDHPVMQLDQAVLQARRQALIDVAGYPLLVQHAVVTPYRDDVPPIASSEFNEQLQGKMQNYLQSGWLHCKLVTSWYVTLALDAALSRKRHDAVDTHHLRGLLKRRWPTLSLLLPDFEHADQLWYLLLTILTLIACFTENWWPAGALLMWLWLSLAGHRREQRQIALRRDELVARVQTMKKVRDRFAGNQIAAEKLGFLLRQLDEREEYFSPEVYQLLQLHLHEA